MKTFRSARSRYARSSSRRPRTVPLPDDGLLAARHAVGDPEAAYQAHELYAAVAALPDDFRDVLVAVDVAGLSYKEAARALRIREGTVMSRLHRGRRQVMRALDA